MNANVKKNANAVKHFVYNFFKIWGVNYDMFLTDAMAFTL